MCWWPINAGLGIDWSVAFSKKIARSYRVQIGIIQTEQLVLSDPETPLELKQT